MDINIPYYEDMTRISNSNIGWFMKYGPIYLHDKLTGKVNESTTQAMMCGTMIHEFLLQPEEFDKDYIFTDFRKPSTSNQDKFCEELINTLEIEPDRALINAYKAAYKVSCKDDNKTLSKAKEMASMLKGYIDYEKSKDKRTPINKWEYERLCRIKDLTKEHKYAWDVLYPKIGEYHHEFHINWDYKYYNSDTKQDEIVKCKSLLDHVWFDFDNKACVITDIKTTVNIHSFEDSVKHYDYTRQLYFYYLATKWYLENERGIDEFSLKNEWQFKFFIIAIDTVQVSEVRLLKIKKSDIISDKNVFNVYDTLKRIHWHQVNDKWSHSMEYYTNFGIETLNLDE